MARHASELPPPRSGPAALTGARPHGFEAGPVQALSSASSLSSQFAAWAAAAWWPIHWSSPKCGLPDRSRADYAQQGVAGKV